MRYFCPECAKKPPMRLTSAWEHIDGTTSFTHTESPRPPQPMNVVGMVPKTHKTLYGSQEYITDIEYLILQCPECYEILSSDDCGGC